jgi:Rad3-related DNA helicase
MSSNDVLKLACEMNACPYYLATSIHPRFKVVVCSYNHVFDPVVRNSLGLRLENSLVICDEAHNIIDAMEGFLTRKLSSKMISDAGKYPLKYTPESIDILKKLDQLLARCDAYFKVVKPGFFTKVKDVMKFLEDSGVTKKWASFSTRTLRDVDNETGFLSNIIAFLHVLANDSDKDVYFQSTKTHLGKDRVMKVSSMEVKSIVDEMIAGGARIAFMSGTLSPGFFQNRIGIVLDVHEYNLPRRNLEVYISDTIPGYQKKLSSYFNERGDESILDGFGEYLLEMLPLIPGGSIAFFPSYDFMDIVIKAWEKKGFIDYDGITRCFFAGTCKIPLFVEHREDKSKRSIAAYKEKTAAGKALLLSIFRGGASEGEDFPGDECRAVFCIGFPVRNVESGETKFKMNYYDSKKRGNGLYWLNWDAMIAVSQAIGRGIRDPINDKAIAVLLDTRYNKNQYSSLLCKWIRECIVMEGPGTTARKIRERVDGFFKRKDSPRP